MDIIDVDAQSRVLSLATRGKVITSRGVTADLSITKTASTNPVIVGQNLTYTLTVKNAGPNAATNAILTDPLPNGMSFVSSSASQGSCNGTTTIICNLGSLENGKTATITIVVKAIAQGTITNTANITAVEPDPNPADNTATATVTANLPQADLSVSASASPDPVLVKKNLTYTIVVTNNGPQSATNVILTDQLPQGSHFISITLNNCSNNGSTISCNLGTLAKSQNTTITIVIQPLSEGTVTNVVSVAGTENDPNQSNNKATVVTDVVLPSCEHKDIVGLMCALKTTANNLDLLFNQLDHGLYETLVAVNNGRKLLSQGRSANLVDDSVTEALEQINLSIETFAELHSLLDLLNEQLANALGTITTMLEAPDLTPAQSAILTKLKLKLEAIEQVALEISNELEALQDKLDSGQSSGDIRSALEAAQEALANDNLDDARTSLNSAYQLIRTALRESKRLVRKKKLLIKNLVSAEGLLSRSTLTSQNENASTIPAQQTLGNGFAITESVHGSILFQTLDANVKSLRLRVYAISGRLVFDREALGSKVSFEGLDSRGAPLANGVYLVVLTVQRGDGSRIASQVQKIVWVR
ncbi:DUF11 domain-containing protein [Candidatus Acetothermia bacterium]|nr:DUF11 domain-containing protein [Candidatus Acetothermia bacterium]